MIQLSVIIPTRNRSALLRQTLESIVAQTFDKSLFEVIVIDNGSTDDTKACVASFDKQLPNLRYHYDARPGLHVGRHDGYHLAQSEILVYADDDIIAFPTWLEAIHENFKNPDVMLVGGKDLPKYEVQPPFWVLEKWYEISSDGHCMSELSLIDIGNTPKEISPVYVYGCNYAVRKSLITETKGFHPDGMPFECIYLRGDGETYVSQYIQEHHYVTMYDPRASVYHMVTKERLTLDYFKKREFCRGVEISYIELREKALSEKTAPKHGKKIRRWINSLHYKNKGVAQLIETLFAERHVTEIDKEILKSGRIGYEYHQEMYRNNAKVREWVVRPDYLDDLQK